METVFVLRTFDTLCRNEARSSPRAIFNQHTFRTAPVEVKKDSDESKRAVLESGVVATEIVAILPAVNLTAWI